MGYFNKIVIGAVLVVLLMSLPLNVFAQTTIAKPPTPQEFTVQYDSKSWDFVVTIKNIDYDLPAGYDINYNIRKYHDLNNYGSYSWQESYQDYYPIQDPSGYTTIKQHTNCETNGNYRVDFEVQALVVHYETETSYSIEHLGQEYTVTKVDSKSEWSSPQSLTITINHPTNIPTPQYTSSNLWNNQLTALINSHWEKLALLVLAAIIVVLAAGLVVLWRKVGNLADQKRPQENSP